VTLKNVAARQTAFECSGTAEFGNSGLMELSCLAGDSTCSVTLMANLNGLYSYDGSEG
jgi:hypothetical protein